MFLSRLSLFHSTPCFFTLASCSNLYLSMYFSNLLPINLSGCSPEVQTVPHPNHMHLSILHILHSSTGLVVQISKRERTSLGVLTDSHAGALLPRVGVAQPDLRGQQPRKEQRPPHSDRGVSHASPVERVSSLRAQQGNCSNSTRSEDDKLPASFSSLPLLTHGRLQALGPHREGLSGVNSSSQ